jgi:transcriptional regulator with XRE-family HTH domain
MINNDILEFVGANLREIRKNKKLSQEDLAEKSGFHYVYIGGVERGERNINLRNLERIANALEIELSELFKLSEIQISNETIRDINALLLERSDEEIQTAFQVLSLIFKTYSSKI